MSGSAVMGWDISEINRSIEEVRRRSTTDAAFRKLALTDPTAAVEKVAGKAVPPGTKIQFLENNGAHFTIVLPDMTAGDASELSDSELEQVAGGGRCAGTCAASCAVTTTITIGIPSVGSIVSI